MPAEDFTVCTSWETCFSYESMELIRSAYSKRRMALGQNPALWNADTRTWEYGLEVDVPSLFYYWQDHKFWSEIQDWLDKNGGYFMQPRFDWHGFDFTDAVPYGDRVPWNLFEASARHANPGTFPDYPEAVDDDGEKAYKADLAYHFEQDYDISGAFTVGGSSGWRVCTNVDYQPVFAPNPKNGGEAFFIYSKTGESYSGHLQPLDYVAGNPDNLDPWIPNDIVAHFSQLYKVRIPAFWNSKGENNVRYGFGTDPDTRIEAEGSAIGNQDTTQFPTASPGDMAVTYYWPDGANEVADCAALWGHGHSPGLPWMVVDIDMKQPFPKAVLP
jgi:hypothetical protein